MNVPRPSGRLVNALLTLFVVTAACTSDPHEIDGGAPDARGGRCTPDLVEGPSCEYRGYGTTCPVACELSAGCTFTVRVEWTGSSYCCGTSEHAFTDCVCEDGVALCEPDLIGARRPPTSTCEFCGTQDAGTDAAIDADSAAPADGGD